MVDTVRDLPTLKAILPDNTTALISPQDIRDMLVSLAGVIGSLTMPETVVAMTGAEAILQPWTTPTVAVGVTATTTGRITVGTAGTYRVTFNACIDISDGGATVPAHVTLGLAKNGTLIATNGARCVIGVPDLTADPEGFRNARSGGFDVLVVLAASDYLEVSHTASEVDSVNVIAANFTVERVS